MLRTFGDFSIRRTRMYRGQKSLPTGTGGRLKQESETNREIVQKIIKNDPALARRIRRLRGKIAKSSKETAIDAPKKIAKSAKPKKAKSKRRPNKGWLAFNKRRQPKLKTNATTRI